LTPPTGSPVKGLPPVRDAHVADLESKLQERFGTKVQLRYRRGKGALEIRFFNDDDLERILKIAGIHVD
ncbi:MAG: hypothetical protein H7X97_11170, partial [Opitutaceae bacterium]|nr:hypothetical protein [Verrucomicrobiales bacterium]